MKRRWRDEVVTAGKGEITEVEGCRFSIIQSDNMPLSWNNETLPDSLELGRLAGKRIMQDDGICHNLHCPGKIRFDRAMHGGACHVPRAGHRGSLAEMIFAICASVVKASQPICQKMWGRDSWRQQGILPSAVKNHALPSLFIHSYSSGVAQYSTAADHFITSALSVCFMWHHFISSF